MNHSGMHINKKVFVLSNDALNSMEIAITNNKTGY